MKFSKETFQEYVMLTAGTLLIALGVYFFKFPNHFSTGGVSGISIILGELVPSLSAGAFVFIINQALLLHSTLKCFIELADGIDGAHTFKTFPV